MSAELPSTTGTDYESLARLVSLSKPPVAVRWRKSLLSEPGLGPTDWKLTAVLEYSAADAGALVKPLRPVPGTKPSLNAADEAWLTPPLRSALDAATVYDAAALGRPPLHGGTISRLGDGTTLVLVMISG